MPLEQVAEDYSGHKPMNLPIVREYGGVKKDISHNNPQIIGEGLTAYEGAPQSQTMPRT